MDDGVMRKTDGMAFLFHIWSAQHFYAAFEPEVSFFLSRKRMEMADWRRFRDRTKEFALSYFPPSENEEDRSA